MPRILALVAATAAVAAVVAAPASATPSIPTYLVTGIETSVPTNGTSTFAGTALSLRAGAATWSAAVPHDSLANCTAPSTTPCSTTLDGGSFSLGGIHGQFVSGGTITLLSGSPITCTSTAAFDVIGTVALAGGGSATFHVRLTHYQTKLFGVCIPYFATVSGTFGP